MCRSSIVTNGAYFLQPRFIFGGVVTIFIKFTGNNKQDLKYRLARECTEAQKNDIQHCKHVFSLCYL